MADTLGNELILKKIDRLREASIGALIPLPQLVVVGDQSSGKSSVLESLTGFSFPRAATLCTRYATQITCMRDPRKRINVSIIPRPSADKALEKQLGKFRRSLDKMDNVALAQIFEEANAAMGIGSGNGSTAFSEDMLKIEIAGPDQIHLTVIDVPGIFRVATEGVCDSDVGLVYNIVKKYMTDSRTIILTVLPCNVDVATQEILKLAEKADPEGVRTMGVLTKPDLATERATQDAVMKLLTGRTNPLRLGYYVLKNRSADDTASSATERTASERAFFMQPPWSDVADRCGVANLRRCLRNLLFEISRRELPRVQAEVRQNMQRCREQLQAMGVARADEASQRQYLVQIINRMERITRSALNGYYMDEPLFRDEPQFKLITQVLQLSEAFIDDFQQNGHYRQFRDDDDDNGVEAKAAKKPAAASLRKFSSYIEQEVDESVSSTTPSSAASSVLAEIDDIVNTSYECPEPLPGPLIPEIRRAYESSRGPELGTYNGAVLASVFVETTQKWRDVALAYISRVIQQVHTYMYQLLGVVCGDAAVQTQIWEGILREELRGLYEEAMEQTQLLVEAECECPPMTLNPRFSEGLQRRRQARIKAQLEKLAVPMVRPPIIKPSSEQEKMQCVVLSDLEKQVQMRTNTEFACEEILDALESYYAVAFERFVDTLYQQVIYRLLQGRRKSLLTLLRPERILELGAEELEAIAGEDLVSRTTRATLQRQLESLQEAARILR